MVTVPPSADSTYARGGQTVVSDVDDDMLADSSSAVRARPFLTNWVLVMVRTAS